VSIYSKKPLSLEGLRTTSLGSRGGKVNTANFSRPYAPGSGIAGLLSSFPQILAADDFRAVVSRIRAARAAGKPVLWGLGGHVVKCGLAPILIDLMRRGYISGFLFNGSTSIHDFEIAVAGYTSEDVEAALPGGDFGISEETGREMNSAIAAGAFGGIGIGEALGQKLQGAPFAEFSLLASAWAARVPVTVHVAIGTDTPHMHPAVDAAALGIATHNDFRLACSLIRELDGGGVYLNVGSAVVLPEVFLKAVSLVRNLGHALADFTTANFDFLQHYRPRVNVLQRPHAQAGGRGYAITGHHELTIPLLAAALIEADA
jgi:hypothetical protein